MPGGGLYRRVAQATTTARDGPDHLLQGQAESKPAPPQAPEVDEPAGPEDVCDVQAFTVWYWTEGPEPSFVPETMYMNSKEGGHKTGEPRLIVSLSSFEALSQAYVMSVEKEGVKAALLQEKEDLLQEVRVGYYKELQHLRELLDMAKEQMALARGVDRLEEAERKRMEEFEREVRETDVHYFNIVEYLEPELKGIMKDAVKEFNRNLMLENYNLRDRLALHEGTEGEEGLAERLITLLMGKGTSPADIVKILAGMVNDKQQSDDLADACRSILGISKKPLEQEEVKKRPRRNDEDQDKNKDKKVEVKEEKVQDNSNARALMKEVQEAKAEADRLREEQELLRQQMEKDRAISEKERDELKGQIEEKRKEMEEAQKALKACEAKLDKTQSDLQKCKLALEKKGEKLPVAVSREDDTPTPTRKVRETYDEDDTPNTRARKSVAVEEETKSVAKVVHSGPSQRDLENAKRMAEEAEAKLKELEARLKEANKKITMLSDDLEAAQAEADAARAETEEERRRKSVQVAPAPVSVVTTPDSGRSRSPTPTPEATKRRPTAVLEEPAAETHEETPKKPKKINKSTPLMDRDFTNVNRDGRYSIVSGKPVAIVEEELIRERGMRIKLEVEVRKGTDAINSLADEKYRLDKECARYEQDLGETAKKLQRLIEADESDGTSDIQIFCRWLIRRYGSLEYGFRALDANRSGGLSFHEFTQGLSQMGWIKIVGRRLYKILDQRETGEVDLSDLLRVFGEMVDGEDDEETLEKNLMLAEQDMKAQEKSDLDVARDRIRKLNVECNDLEEENKRLKNLASKAEVRSKGTKGDGGEGVKNMERKCDLIKEAYEKQKEERDEITSKMTAAMWKCREAHILQVKYQRQAETNQQELGKLQRKYNQLRAAYKRKHGQDPEDPGFEYSVAAGSTLDMNSVAQMSAALLTHPNMLKTFGSSFSIEEDTEMSGTAMSSPSGGKRCPKCNASIRLTPMPDKMLGDFEKLQHSASSAELQKWLKSATAGNESGEDSGGERLVSAEDYIDHMTDDDLLFGSPAVLASMNLTSAHKSGAAYREKTFSHAEKNGKKHRWQLLFSDAQDRRAAEKHDSVQAVSQSGDMSPTTADVVLSQESMNLLEHAKKVRGMWREAVPMDNAFASIDEEKRKKEEDLRGAEAVRVVGSGTSRSFGVGGAAVSSSIAGSAGGRVYLGSSRRDLVGTPPLLGSLGGMSPTTSISAPTHVTALRGPSQSSAPPPNSFLEANNLQFQPSGEGSEGFQPTLSNFTTEVTRSKGDSSPEKRSSRRQVQREPSPEQLTPNLQIVGNDSNTAKGNAYSSPVPTAGPSKLPSSERRTHVVSPPLTVSSWGEAGPAPNFEENDEGLHGHSLGRGNSQVVGMWKRHSYGKGGELSGDAATQALGDGLPASPGPMRSSPSLVRGGALRRVPAQLPTLDAARNSSKEFKRPSDKLLSTSMPDLGVHLSSHLERLGNAVRTPPLAGTSPDQHSVSPGRKVRSRKITSALERVPAARPAPDGAAGAAPFEAPFLYVGNPPISPSGVDLSLRSSHTIGASHTVPSGLRNQFMMAASALELGSHVQRHAANGDENDPDLDISSPLIVQQASAVPRTLLS